MSHGSEKEHTTMATQIQRIATVRRQLDELRLEKHSKADTLTSAQEREYSEKARGLMNELSGIISEGAEPCEHCGQAPHGMVQEVAVKNIPRPYFEVGCLGCKDHRAQGFTPEQAVADWNAENYLPPKKPAEPPAAEEA